MSENKKAEPKSVSRRDFLKDAGIVLGGAAAGSALLLTGCREEKEVTKTISAFVCPVCQAEFDSLGALQAHFDVSHPESGATPTKSSYISWNEDECAACSRCVMACSAIHTGAIALQTSGIKWIDSQEFYGFEPRMPLFCQQCSQPECYFACPLKDIALCIDKKTGARYINETGCNGCGECVEACPFEIPRVNIDLSAPIAERKAYKCDLCKDRENGPVCIEVCNRDALTLVAAEGRL